MLSKNQRGYDENAIPRHRRFRHNLADACLARQMTAARAASLFTGAEAAGATSVDDLANLGPKNADTTSLAQVVLVQNLVQNSLLESQEADPRNGGYALLAPPRTGGKAF